MKKKMLAAAIASALAVPSAFAAIDDAGMKYTSASEGFYGSFRFGLYSEEDNDLNTTGGVSRTEGTRLGVQGDVDIGHGNTAFYRLEWEYDYNVGSFNPGDTDPARDSRGRDNNAFRARLGYGGLRGKFGSVQFGRMWSADYDYVFSLADVTNNVTGNFAPRFRVSNALRYDSPDIQGFNFSIQVHADDRAGRSTRSTPVAVGDSLVLDADVPDLGGITDLDSYNLASAELQFAYRRATGLEEVRPPVDDADTGLRTLAPDATALRTPAVESETTTDPDDGNEFDRYILAAGYSIRGVNLGVTYVSQQAPNSAAAHANEDTTTWGLGGSYGQDNWKVAYNYGDTSDAGNVNGTDQSWHAVSGQAGFDKVTLRAVFETRETEELLGDFDQDIFTLEAQYNFSSRARAYANYQSNDLEDNPNRAGAQDSDSDTFYIAYRVDF